VEHQPQSFHASPAEARRAPEEEFLYLACLHQGTGVEKPDFLADVDAETGRIVHETPMPNVGDEPHHFGWNRCSSPTAARALSSSAPQLAGASSATASPFGSR
jgi:hypothetical protein